MVTHIVIFRWIAGVTSEQVDQFSHALDTLSSDLRDLTRIQHGPDLRFRDGNGDYAVIATFTDRAGWNVYQAHPRHKTFVRDFVVPMQASRLTIQL